MKIVPARYALFSGCAVEHTGSSARRATIALARTLGIELWEAPARGCCGARVDRPAGEKALRDLSTPLVEAISQGLAIACLSPGCRQVIASHLLPIGQGKPDADPDAVPPRVMDIIQFLTREDDPDRLPNALVRSLAPLRVALHHTCHGDHIPSPDPAPQRQSLIGTQGAPEGADGAAERADTSPSAQALAGLIAVTGAEPLEDVSVAGRCAETPLLPAPVGRQMEAPPCLAVAARLGIDVLVTPCFLCFGVLNERQRRLSRDDPARAVPVLHLAQLLGMACGAAPVDLELGRITA
ncbi:MAG: heterodisulfide reductase-related iron-sulfur binding cluster, partial [Chloroflexota bacterium]